MMMIWLVTIILAAVMLLLVTEKFPVDLVSIGIIVILAVTGILTPTEAIAGFASPAVITVGAMFLISRGMIRTGAVDYVSQLVMRHAKGSPLKVSLLVLVIVGVASAFINNTPVVVLFIPIVLSLSCELNFSPSKLLMPISYASILAGTCTLIGTSTNIVISDMSASYGFGSIGMFELSRLGVPVAILGVLYLIVAAPKLMPDIHSAVCETRDAEHRQYLAELQVSRGSHIIGEKPEDYFAEKFPDMEVLEVIRYSHVFYPGRDEVAIAPDDILLVKGTASDMVEILHDDFIELPLATTHRDSDIDNQESLVVELVITPQSSLLGERLVSSRLARDRDIRVMAIKRRTLHYDESQVKEVRLKIGDILLAQLPESSLERLRNETDFIVIEDIHHNIVQKRLAKRAFMIFGAMVIVAATGLADILVASLTAAFLMVITGCLQLRRIYGSIDSRVLLIIVAMMALSTALTKTGASEMYAQAFLGLFKGMGPAAVLSGLILMTSISTHVLSNNATAILLLPMAVSAAQGMGVDPKPFIIAVCFGASACFAAPIGYQTNLLVYGPGGYRFSDYVKLGMPLNLLVFLAGSLFIPMLWPF
jgi:di/tricarboxylate transporter